MKLAKKKKKRGKLVTALNVYLIARMEKLSVLLDAKHEIDMEGDMDNEVLDYESSPTIEGYLLKGPKGSAEKAFVNIATKSFKRRFCKLRQHISGSYFLDICKEEKKQDATTSINLDECQEILRFRIGVFPRLEIFSFQFKLNRDFQNCLSF